MSEQKRPGGLTALAVINFVFSGWGFIGLLGLAAFFAFIGKIPTDDMNEAQKAQFEAFQNMGLPVFIFIFALSIISSVLLLLSGIGYLKLKKFLGRMIGNTYAVIAIVSSIISGIMFAPELGGGFNIGTIIGLIYPIVTLILLNTTFKGDLTK
jgi:tryptophan-rich sensory protein